MNNSLILEVDKQFRIISRESSHREYKEIFDLKKLSQYCKTLVSFANRDGGAIYFGIKDKPHDVIGINETPDILSFTHFIKDKFEPEINIKASEQIINGKCIYIVEVEKAIKKPIICKKEYSKTVQYNKEKAHLREGAIYYRYNSSTEEIKCADLKNILDAEVANIFRSLVENITLFQKIGYDKAGIIDLENLPLSNSTSIYLTKDVAKHLNWIKEGKLVSDPNKGDSAYYVKSEVDLKIGNSITIPTDFCKTHPLTKTALSKAVELSINNLNLVTQTIGIANNSKYHIPTSHGKNAQHKYSESCVDLILQKYPLSIKREERIKLIKLDNENYKDKISKAVHSKI
ncbi:TPA: AlbA family DNA-binding domain-containing protein [Legionella pneumophila]